jgi:hypothetical protein
MNTTSMISHLSHNHRHAFVVFLLAAICVAAFRPCITFPFIMDDWSWINLFQSQGAAELLPEFFRPHDKLMYRPLGQAYLLGLFQLVGAHSVPFHLLGLLIHITNACLIYGIANHLTHSLTLAVLTSAVYASAVASHLDPLCWAVGIYDLGGGFFFFLSVWLYLQCCYWRSALSFLCATLFKESTVLLPGVFVAIEVARRDTWDTRDIARRVRCILPHVAVMLAVLSLRLAYGTSPLRLSESHPYVVAIYGSHGVKKAYLYCVWMLQAFVPFGSPRSSLFYLLLNNLFVLTAVCLMVRRSAHVLRVAVGVMLWVVVALLPVLFLPNQTYRYYTTYALPAFVCGVFLLADQMLRLSGAGRMRGPILALVGTLVVSASVLQANRIFRQGLKDGMMADGSNYLVRRAKIVEITRSALSRQVPPAIDDAVILLQDVDLWAFDKDAGPRVWFHSDGVSVYDLADLRVDEGQFYLESPIRTHFEVRIGAKRARIPLAQDRIHAYQLVAEQSDLRKLGEDEVQEVARRQTMLDDDLPFSK